MNDLIDSLITVSIPITATDRRQAAAFADQQVTPEKATQVYRNTIAVLVCDRYLQTLAIPSILSASQSWDRIDRWLNNVADLFLPDVQKSLECRSIFPGDSTCFIPPEVQENRVGYLVVQLDESYQEGILLGFVPRVAGTELAIRSLQPLDTLIDAIILPASVPAKLRDWLKGKFEPDWIPCLDLDALRRPTLQMSRLRTIDRSPIKTEALHRSIAQLYQQDALTTRANSIAIDPDPISAIVRLMQTTAEDEIRWQAAELLWQVDPSHAASPVVSAKDIGLYLGGQAIALMVGVLPKLDDRHLILLRLYPIQAGPWLPKNLKLAVFDDSSNLIIELQSRERDQYVQFKLTADPGDGFQVKISLNEASVIESFLV